MDYFFLLKTIKIFMMALYRTVITQKVNLLNVKRRIINPYEIPLYQFENVLTKINEYTINKYTN